jgi:hypothetical protein
VRSQDNVVVTTLSYKRFIENFVQDFRSKHKVLYTSRKVVKYASFDVSNVTIEHRMAEIWLKQKMGAISKTILPLHFGIWRGSNNFVNFNVISCMPFSYNYSDSGAGAVGSSFFSMLQME